MRIQRQMCALLAAVCVTSSLSACQFVPPRWTYNDSDQVIKRPGESLAAVDRLWRVRLSQIREDLRITEDSRCFYQVSPGTDANGTEVRRVGAHVLCGPYRPIGSNSTRWDVAPITYNSATRTIELDPAGFSPGKVAPGTRGERPDGKVPRFDIDLAEPDSPISQVGDLVPAGPQDSPAMTPLRDVLTTPGGEYTFSVGQVERLGSVAERRTAPANSSFLVIDSAEKKTPAGASRPDTISVIVDGKVFPVGNSADVHRLGVALPAGAKKILIGVTFDGLTQTVDVATGARETPVPSLYGAQSTVSATTVSYEIGMDSTLGNRVAAHFDPNVRVDLWDPVLGWAPTGQAWAHIEGTVSLDTLMFLGPNLDEEYVLSSAAPGLTMIDGTPARAVSATKSGDSTVTLSAVVPVPNKPGTSTAHVAVKIAATKKPESQTDNPSSYEQELRFPIAIAIS